MQVHIMTCFSFANIRIHVNELQKIRCCTIFTNSQYFHLFSFVQIKTVHVQSASGNAFARITQMGQSGFPRTGEYKNKKNKTVVINKLAHRLIKKARGFFSVLLASAPPERSLVLHLCKDVT